MANVDQFVNAHPRTREASAVGFINVTPSDSADLVKPCRGISFATAGALKITTIDGTTDTIPNGNLAAGIIHPIEATRIWDTGTDAVYIVAWY